MALTITRRVYTSNDTWTKPVNLIKVDVIVTGGGGGGGGADVNVNGQREAGGGGYAGGTAIKMFGPDELDGTEPVVVGSGGAGGVAGDFGDKGNTSSFGTGPKLQATGGGGGDATAGPGGGTDPTIIGRSGGVPGGDPAGIGTLGDINLGGGGGSAGWSFLVSGEAQAVGGTGGASYWGGGGRGGIEDENGETATAYGAGGGGASEDDTTGRNGGAGASGVVVIVEYCAEASDFIPEATLAAFEALHNHPPTSAFATLELRNNRPVLDFDKDTDEEAVFFGIIPRSYSHGSVKVLIHFAARTLTTGTVRWQAAFERIAANDLDIDTSDGFASFQSAGASVPSTAGKVAIATISFTQAEADGILAGNPFRLKIRRDADGSTGTDDLAEDAVLLLVEVKEG